jgi:hypothetical protein
LRGTLLSEGGETARTCGATVSVSVEVTKYELEAFSGLPARSSRFPDGPKY